MRQTHDSEDAAAVEAARFPIWANERILQSAVSCLDDAVVLALVSGELTAADLAGVDAHLDTCPDCRALVVTFAHGAGTGAPGGETSGASAADAGVLRRGAKVGRYIVGEIVGGGAMGFVVAARDPELGRDVALKLLHPSEGLHTHVARERLLREAQAMARLQHPNVIAVYEVGVVGESVFLAMELVQGATLRAWMSTQRTWRDVCDVMDQAGRGLSAAHAAGLVHRDIKPDNIIVGDDGRVRVGDFGLACGTDAPDAGLEDDAPLDPPLARTSALVGTPAYMAPETFGGVSAGPLSDQFGFSVAFFEALHGCRPFAGATVAKLREAITAGRVVPTSRPVPTWLSAALRRGLAASFDGRPPRHPREGAARKGQTVAMGDSVGGGGRSGGGDDRGKARSRAAHLR